MNIEQKEVVIFMNMFGDKPAYSIGLSKKKQDNTWENGFIPCQFKKGVEIANKTKIKLINAWLTFYKTKDNKTAPYIFVNEYEVVSDGVHKEVADIPQNINTKYETNGTILQDDDLPF